MYIIARTMLTLQKIKNSLPEGLLPEPAAVWAQAEMLLRLADETLFDILNLLTHLLNQHLQLNG
jgi:hypothetical protein